MSGLWILDDSGEPVPEPDVLQWAEWFEKSELRVLAVKHIGSLRVSTVFLGINHNFGAEGPPLLYETMVFGLPDDEEIMDRYSTRNEAEVGHQVTCDLVRKRLAKEKVAT